MIRFIGLQNVVAVNNFANINLYDAQKNTLERAESASNQTVDYPLKVYKSAHLEKLEIFA